ncbi:MAG: hypothetical protein GY722_20205 [bacterium]|nr:hypothetical protein [bacterium]
MIEDVRSLLASIPEVSGWPEMSRLIQRPTASNTKPCWEYPVLACRSAGGTEEQALPGAAAIFCLVYSMQLVDDLLDQDPRGIQHEVGEGTTANLGLAFQAAASILVERTEIPPERRAAIQASLAQIALATAFGQNLDLADIMDEQDYWRVVEAKTPPLFSGALRIGGLLGSASDESAEGLHQLGFLLGKLIQISDDLKDALEKPARPDWRRKWNNLPILYALTADHSDRSRFTDLLDRIEEPAALAEAQELLIRSGGVSFCTYHMIELYRSAKALLRKIPLQNLEPMESLLNYHAGPLKSLFMIIGADLPEELLT